MKKSHQDILSRRWSIEILMEFYNSKTNCRRYSDFKRNISGITPRALSCRLKELSEAEIITKSVDASSFSVKCEYRLSSSGKDFMKIAALMKTWSRKWRK